MVFKPAGSQPALPMNSTGIQHTHTYTQRGEQVVKPWDFHLKRTYRNLFFFFVVSISSPTKSNSRVTNAKLWTLPHSKCRRWDLNHVFPLYTVTWGSLQNPQCKPSCLPPSRESPACSTLRFKPDFLLPVPSCCHIPFLIRPWWT